MLFLFFFLFNFPGYNRKGLMRSDALEPAELLLPAVCHRSPQLIITIHNL